MPTEGQAMMEGHAQAVALLAATHRAITAGDHLPWEQVDEIVRGDYAREALVSLASLCAFTLGVVGEGIRLPPSDFLDVLAATCAAEIIDEEIG